MINKIRNVYLPEAKYMPFLEALGFSGVAYGLYKGVQDNYLAEIAHINAFERGIVEFFRETPGLLVVLILALMHRFADGRIFKIGTALMLAGLTSLLIASTGKIPVVLFIVVFSSGEHIIMPVKSAISMSLAKDGAGGKSLGMSSALGQAGNIAGFIMVMALFFCFSKLNLGLSHTAQFKTVFLIAAILMIGSVIVALAVQEDKSFKPRRRFCFAKKFTTYYMLEVFYGARKQVFYTFVPYVLILQYGANTSLMQERG
jgi:hypothetical protein